MCIQESNSVASFGKPTITLDNDYEEIDNGIEGSIILQVTINDKVKKMNFLSTELSPMLVDEICQFLGYRQGSKRNQNLNYMQMRQEQIFKINKKSCRNILDKIISNKDLGIKTNSLNVIACCNSVIVLRFS